MVNSPDQFKVDEIPEGTLHVIRGTLWYVFEKMPVVVNNIFANVKPQDGLLMVQNFPDLNSNFVGKNIIPNPTVLVNHFISDSVTLGSSIWHEKFEQNSNDSWFIGYCKQKSAIVK